MTINKDLQNFLYDRDWLKEIQSQWTMINKIEKFCESIQLEESTLSEALHLWLNIEGVESLRDTIMLSNTAILAYMLDHRYRGTRLKSELKFRASKLMLKHLKEGLEDTDDDEEYRKFLEYRSIEGNFKGALNELSCEDFWKSCEDYAPKLSAVGSLYTSLPAGFFSLKETTVQMNGHEIYGERHSKAIFIHNFLRSRK